jgi:DME family drug/metabolite transporter
MPFTSTSARWRLLGVALLFSTGGAAIKGTALSSWQVACLRSAVATVALLVLLPEARRGLTAKNVARSLLVGIGYAGTMVMFVAANKLTTAANAIFLQATAPLYLLLLGPWLLKEPVRRRDLGFLALAAAGMAFFLVGTPEPTKLAPNPRLGDLLALASGATYAVVIAGMRWLGKADPDRDDGSSPAATAVIAGNAVAALACAPLALPIASIATRDVAAILFLGIFQIGLAYAWMARAMPHVPAFEASILLLAEPVFNPLWTWLTQGETPGPFAFVGGALILGATVLKAWLDRGGRTATTASTA